MEFDGWGAQRESLLFGTAATKAGGVGDDGAVRFVAGGGVEVKIRQRAGPVGPQEVDWASDESYGININGLLDSLDSGGTTTTTTTTEPQSEVTMNLNELLVEKYRPKNFLDLVGNERTNRRILFWLRQWSPLVFNEKLPPPPTQYKPKKPFSTNGDNNNEDDTDFLKRPIKKILLIHGPPGIGKTSVAHVVARQAGYSITEINASDERAGPEMKQKILNSLFNNSLMDKPVCLIADEIDGSVESGFVKVLVDIINRDQRAVNHIKYSNSNHTQNNKHNNSRSNPRKGKSDKHKSHILKRPIITICNNLYAPSLEKLRPYCEIIYMKKPIDSAIQEKLSNICQLEDINLDIKEINNLIDIAQGDIRNCINNLQFMSNNNNNKNSNNNNKDNKNNSTDKNSNTISKDTSILWFKLVNNIFKRDPHVELRKQFYEILNKIESSGNFDKIVQGCFNLYPLVKYSDNGLTKPSELADWLYFHDLMHKSIYEQNGELNRYTTITPLTFFQKFSDIANRDDLRIKNSDFEIFENRKFNLDMIKSMINRISTFNPKLSKILDNKSFIFEILPYLNQIFSTDLIRTKDIKLKNELIAKLLSLLKDFQLNLIDMENELSNTTSKVLSIDLPFDKIVVLDDKKMKDIAIRRPHNLNLLLIKSEEFNVKKRHFNKILQEKATLEENKKAKVASNSLDFFKNQYDSISNTQQSVNEDTNSDPKLNKNNNNFFNRSSANVNNNSNDKNNKNNEHIRIWVKYKAGFSNAVRKNVSWNDLWE